MATDYPESIRDVLTRAGWFAGRKVSPDVEGFADAEVFERARLILTEFNGLHIGECGPGIECATSDIVFNASLGRYLMPELRKYEPETGAALFPLGEVHRGHGYLIVDDNGRTYLLSDELQLLSDTFPRALEMLLLGIRPRSS